MLNLTNHLFYNVLWGGDNGPPNKNATDQQKQQSLSTSLHKKLKKVSGIEGHMEEALVYW